MAKFCGNCGSPLDGEYCTNCGVKAEAKPANSDVNEYFHSKMVSKKKHNTYRLVVGIIMIILGFFVTLGGLFYDSLDISSFDGMNLALCLIIPGFLMLIGGIFSIISRSVNVLLLISGIAYAIAAILNAIGIENVSLLFILCVIFAPINITYYVKALNIKE